MSIIFKHIINAFLFLCIVKSSFLFSQTFNPQTQNRSWSANSSISTVFLKASGVDITITPNLNMIQFVDSNGDTYGYDGDNDIPTNWTYEILDGNDDVPADTTVSADKKTIIFTADPDEDIDIYLKVIDNNGNIIDNLSRVQLRLYIRGNLTVASAQWNACEQAYLLSVNEQTRDGVKLCAPYRVIVYELKSGSIDTSNVIYDSNNDSGHNVNSNSFTLNLGVGNYAAIITNSCNEQVNSSGDGYYYFSVTEAYSIGASSIFSGYQCVGDGFGTTVIKLEGAAKPITWQLKNSNGQVILTHNNTSQYSYQNYNEQFDTQNFTVTIPNLSTGTYTFTFTDGNACSEDLTFKIQRPEEIKASVIQNDSKLQLACYGDSDGEITFLASGGWTEPWDGNYVNPNGWGDPYTFSLTKDGKTFSSGDVLRHFVNGNQVGYKTSFTGLSAGSYSLIVRENVATNPYNSDTIYNCAKVFQQTFTISEPDEFTSSGSVTDIDCNGNESGAIDLSVDGGTANYIYAWTKTGDDSYSATTQDLTDLSAGTYNVTITDASDCTTTNSFTIVEPTELIIADAGLSTEIACFGDNGQIRVDITQESVPATEDSTPEYTYALYQGDSVVQTTTTSDLNYTFDAPAGTYKVRVTDASGCFKETSDITLTQPDPISISTNNISNVSCNGGSDGFIDITISGGTLSSSAINQYIGYARDNDSDWGTYKTTDGGQTWNKTNNIAYIEYEFPSENIGYARSSKTPGTSLEIGDSCQCEDGTYKTTDGGVTWNKISDKVFHFKSFPTNDIGYAKEWPIGGGEGGRLYKTVDGGQNWNLVNNNDFDSNGESYNELNFVTELIGYGTLNDGLYKTTDGGINWTKIHSVVGVSHSEFDFPNENIGYSSYTGSYHDSASNETSQGSIRTSDGGVSWNNINTMPGLNGVQNALYLSDFSFVNGNIGWAHEGGNTLRTIDGGQTWNIINSQVYYDYDFIKNNSSSYTIQWTKEGDPNFSANTEDISDLSSGTYTITITDSNDCSFSDTFTISEPDELTSSGSITNIDCNGNENGAIDLSVNGGTANYIYAWTKTGDDSYSATTQDLTDLSGGTYNVTITDANDCTTTNSFTIIEPGELIIADAGLSTEIACFGDNGLIGVNITQATAASYTYALYQGDSVVQTTTISDLNYTFSAPAGTYEVRVTDANGCASSFTTELTQAEEELLIDIEKTDLNCYNSNNGTITVTTSGGVAPYTFSWSDSGTSNYRDGLTIGTYTVTITDSIGCVKVRTVEIENGDLFNIDPVVTPISCFGADDGSIELNLEGGVSPISFIWSDDSNAGQSRNNLPPGDYSVLIQDASGCEIQRDFTIIEPEEISISAVVTNATDCDNPASGSIDLQISGGNSPYIFQWSNGAVTEDISALIAQTYSVTVTDSKGCIFEKEFTITRPDDLEIDLATNIYAVCESREVFQNNTLSISGGVAPYIIQWSGGEVTGNNNEIMDTKIDGSYQVTVTDALGCSESISFDVSTPEIGFPDFTYDSFYLSNYDALSTKDPIDFTNLSTEDFFSVYWDFGDGNYSEEVDAQHTYDKKGTYQVTLTVEFILGCSYSITKTIYIGDSFEIVIPNAFTPNNDGYNDNFRAVYYGFKYLKMQIFDTWGTLIYSEESRTDELIGWNGRIGSKDGENGNYFYQVSGNSFTDVKFAKNGSFTLIR